MLVLATVLGAPVLLRLAVKAGLASRPSATLSLSLELAIVLIARVLALFDRPIARSGRVCLPVARTTLFVAVATLATSLVAAPLGPLFAFVVPIPPSSIVVWLSAHVEHPGETR